MPTKKIIERETEFQVPSPAFNFLYVVNLSQSALEIDFSHNDLMIPVLVIREKSEEDKEIQGVLDKYEGKEI